MKALEPPTSCWTARSARALTSGECVWITSWRHSMGNVSSLSGNEDAGDREYSVFEEEIVCERLEGECGGESGQ